MITDEMISKAELAINDVLADLGMLEDTAALTVAAIAKAAVTAALAHLPGEPVGVKALEWTPWTGSASYAYSSIGDFSVDRDEDEDMSDTPFVAWGQDDNLGHHPTLEEAKAAAQSDYEQRIRSALIPIPDSRDAEIARLREALGYAAGILDGYADPTSYTDNNGEQLPPDAEVHSGLLAKEAATKVRAALSLVGASGEKTINDAVLAERERCAKIALEDRTPGYGPHRDAMEYLAETQRSSIAERIRLPPSPPLSSDRKGE